MIKYYLVGGYVRDLLMEQKSKDVDFAVEAPSYEDMRNDLLNNGITIWQERPEFFAIRASHPELKAADYVLCRKEGFYSDNRHPDSVEPGTIYDDLARRDFTVNAIAIEWYGFGEKTLNFIIDPHGGEKDIATKTLRCVGSAEDRFKEDALRILRAVRFHIVKGFKFDDEINQALFNPDLLYLLTNISKERIYEELRKCFEFDSYKTWDLLKSKILLSDILFKDIRIGLEPRI